MRCQWCLPALMAVATSLSWAQTSAATECEAFFQPDSPALFDFVETRKQVNFDFFAGQTIAGVKYLTLPIFNEQDPDEDHWVYRLANSLHINTRAKTLKKQVVFSEGEALDPQIIRESERILRGNDYLVDAMILPEKRCGNLVYLLVVARDVWTISPTASASRSGGDNKSDYGISDSNLLGRGQTVSIAHYSNSERSGNNFAYRHPDIIGDHTEMEIGLENNSDGDGGEFYLARPFFELDARWSAGISYSEFEQVETIELQDTEINKYVHMNKNAGAFVGWSAGRQNGVVERWTTGVVSNEATYETVSAPVSVPPQDRTLRYPWVQWSMIEDQFITLSNITHSHRNEDILVGFHHSINIGYASESLDSSEDAWIYSASTGYTAGFGTHHLLRVNLGASGRYNLDTHLPESTFYRGQAEYYNYPNHKKRWYASVRYIAGRNLNDDEQLTAGDGDNLRGYPSDYQRGNKQWLLRLEGRYFTDIHLFNLAYIGGATYLDAGRTWNSDEPTDEVSDDTLANIGFGLRLSPSKFNIDKVLHADIAVPLVNRDEVDSYQVILSGRVDF